MDNKTNSTDDASRSFLEMLNLTASIESSVANKIDLYLPPILFATGLVCNTLVILVMRAPYFSKVSTSLYMSFNALIDNVSLLIVLPVHWLHVNFPDAIYRGPNSDLICKALNFLGWGTSDLGIILTSAMTMERAIAIKFPLQSASYCTVKKARYVIGCLMVFIILKDGIFLAASTLMPLEEEAQLCGLDTSDPGISFYAESVHPVIHNVFLAISFIIIIISNIAIVISVKSSEGFPPYPSTVRAHNQQGSNSALYKSRASTRGRQLTIMLISDSLTIVVCTLPFSIVTSIYFGNIDVGTRHLIIAVSFYLLYVNRCANFFLYCISGERFRMGLKELCAHENESKSFMSIYSPQNDNLSKNDSEDSYSGFQCTDSRTRSFSFP